MTTQTNTISLKVGDKAPDFRLFNTDKQPVTLESYRGKSLIIHFFPLAFTGVCTTQLCSVRDAITMYSNDTTDVVAISTDTPHTLAKFKETLNLNFTLLSDYNQEASEAYGAQYEVFACEMKGISKRAAFVVDKDGIIQYAEVLENAGELPSFEKINETLNAIS